MYYHLCGLWVSLAPILVRKKDNPSNVTRTLCLFITGDYFGILMKERVTGFPFNVCDNPMYVGSTCTFLATALWYKSPAGVLLTGVVYIVYKIALSFEE